MKTTLILLLAAFSFSGTFAQNKTPYQVTNLTSNIQYAEVSTSGGSIEVLHENGAQQRIEVFVKGNNDKELSKDVIEQRLKNDYELSIEIAGGKLVAKAKRIAKNNDWKNSLSISFKVFVPATIETQLATSGGSITLSGIEGKQKFATSGGSLNITKVKGEMDGATSGGSISVEQSNGKMDLATSGGSIVAKQSTGNLHIATSGGSIVLTDLDGNIDAATSGGSVNGQNISGELKASTSGGSVNLTGLRCNVKASTSGGGMNVTMVVLKDYVQLSNSSGNINLQVPAGKGMDLDLKANKIYTQGLSNFSGSSATESMSGSVQGGGTKVSVRASSGNINISFIQ
jgi:hypothetical protein